MQRIRALLHEVAKHNTNEHLNAFFIDPRYGVAFAGYRRLYGCGDCLVRIQAPNIEMGNIGHVAGTFSYTDEKFYLELGLRGKELPDGRPEVVDAEVANNKFLAVHNQVSPGKNVYGVLLNPKMICDFIEERTGATGFVDKKINIQIFDGINWLGEVAAQIESENGVPYAKLRVGPNEYGRAFIDDKESHIKSNRLLDGKYYIVRGIRVDEYGIRWVKVVREYKRGLRFAIQTFRNGLLLPNQPRYSVLDDKDHNIGVADILDVPFIDLPEYRQGNQEGNFFQAPMLHIDVDTFYRALKPMDAFKVVEMRFKDSITGIYISTMQVPDQMVIDAIIGPTSPYKSGKVYTA
jgi:hypothetical protein